MSSESNVYNLDMTATWIVATLQTIFVNYKLDQTYSTDEFRLFYQVQPGTSFHLGNQSYDGRKHKVCLTDLATRDALRDKPPIFVTEKYMKPSFTGSTHVLYLIETRERTGWILFYSKNGFERSIKSLHIGDNIGLLADR